MKKSIILVSIILAVLVIASVVIFAVPFQYKAVEHYSIQEPYSDTEYYYEKVPYSSCTHRSFWTGECDVWTTKYRDVRKSRIVTLYRTLDKERDVWKKDTLFNMMAGNTKYYFQT